MHIVLFVDYPDSSLGGVQTSVSAQRKALEKAGHTVTMVTPPAKRQTNLDEHTIFVPGLPYSPYEYPLVLPSRHRERWIIKELSKRPPIDIIHVHTDTGVGIMGVHIARHLKKTLIQTMHTRDDVFIQKTVRFPWLVTIPAYHIHRLLLRAPSVRTARLNDSWSVHYSWRVMVRHAEQADIVTVPSRHFAKRLKEHGVTKPIEVVSNGLDDDMLREIWDELKPKVSKPTLPLKIAWVGRLTAEKRPLLCLEVVKNIPDTQISLYGEGADEGVLRRYIDEHGLADRVHLKGRVSQAEVIRAVAEHDVFVQSSYGFDTQSMVLLESIAAGTPIVLSDPDLAESLPDGTGIVTATPDAKGLQKVISRLLLHPEELTKMQAAMWSERTSVAQSKMTEKMLRVYRTAIDNNL